MKHTTIVLTLPEEVVENWRQIASAGHRTVEEVMVEMLTAHQPDSEDYDKLLAPLADFNDSQLWDVVNETLMPEEKSRYEMLIDKRQRESISKAEQQEINHLVHKIELQMLFRSEALALLKARGHEVSHYFSQKPHAEHS